RLQPHRQTQRANVNTIQRISATPRGELLQRAFIKSGGAQCGICTPGMIVAAASLLKRHPAPSEEDLREGLSGNLCRCTGYTRIFEAVMLASREAVGGHE